MSPLPALSSQPSLTFDTPVDALDAMFCAVAMQLQRGAVRDRTAETDVLRAMLAHGAEPRRRLEQIADDVQAALLRAPAPFVDLLDLALRASPIGRLRTLARQPAHAT